MHPILLNRMGPMAEVPSQRCRSVGSCVVADLSRRLAREGELIRGFGLVLLLLLTGCGSGEGARWIAAENKIVSVEDIPYQVSWVRDVSGIDMRGVRVTPIVIMPDPMVERRRNTEAAIIVGTSLCGGKASVVSEMKEGDLFNTRVKCG
jgi:hypothetical protein